MELARKRVLIVDDEEDLTWSISKHLAKDREKYELIGVNSGKKALEVMTQLPVDLVISDIRMPEITGMELLVKIKDYYPNTKVIIMTAYGSSEVQDQANKLGCLHYLEKPFEISELRRLILEAIEDPKGFRGTISDFQLSDLIQINCLGRFTTSLHVSQGSSEGTIYFEEGNIVHSESGDLDGEDAFYEILTWEGGSFSTNKNVKAPRETILKGWQSLLLEGMRRMDEARPKQKKDAEEEREKRISRMNDTLDNILQVKGVKMVIVFDPEGFPLASRISEQEKNYNMRELAPVFSNFIKQLNVVGKELELSENRDLVAEFKNGILKITRIPDRAEYLIILAEAIQTLTLLRMEVKKRLKELAKVL
jgi:CheY-like chemotaxis protein